MSVDNDDLEELASEIRRLIQSNNKFLERVTDEEFELDDESDESAPGEEEDPEDYEEL